MIVVKLAGGMGNQMFQYALGKLNSLKYNKRLILDLSFLLDRNQGTNFTYRDYDLDIFNLEVGKVDSIELNDSFVTVTEPGNHFPNSQFLNLYDHIPHHKNIYISGYFQKHDYIKNLRSSLITDFTLKEKLEKKAENLLEEITSTNSVCVNIRRADYVTNKNMTAFHGVYGEEYITKGMEVINKKVNSPHVFIFSDDMEWCEKNLIFECPHTFVGHEYKGRKFGQYLYLMSQCKNFIIPNSSFGWWAAWLCENNNKIVITPKKWFQDPNMVTEGLRPPDWITI
jgi:hypothetical protein